MLFKDTSRMRKLASHIFQLESLLELTMNDVAGLRSANQEQTSRIDKLQTSLNRFENMLARSNLNDLALRTDDLLKLHEKVGALEDELQRLRAHFQEQRSQTSTEMKEVARVISGYEVRFAAIEASIKGLGARTISSEADFDIFEGRSYGVYVSSQVHRAWKNRTNPKPLDPFKSWLTREQRDLLSLEYDVLVGVYLKTVLEQRYAYVSNLIEDIGRKKSEITDEGTRLIARGLTKGRTLTTEEWRHAGSRPFIFEPTDACLRLFFGPGTSATSEGPTHFAMQLSFFQEVICLKPRVLYFAITQKPGECRPDGGVFERIDSKAWKWSEGIPAIFETPEEVRADSSLSWRNEGQVFLNMITPFAAGCRQVLIVCMAESFDKVMELKNALPHGCQKKSRSESSTRDGLGNGGKELGVALYTHIILAIIILRVLHLSTHPFSSYLL